MREHILLVLQADFVRKVNQFIDFLVEILPAAKGLDEELVKAKLWELFKAQWVKAPGRYDKELFDSLPEELKNPLVTIELKRERGTLKLDNGHEVPMYNYKGEMVSVASIPSVLAQIGSHTVYSFDKDGKTSEDSKATSEIIKAMKTYPKN